MCPNGHGHPLAGLHRFEAVLARLSPGKETATTPCASWNARALVGHVLTVLESADATLRGEDFDWSAPRDPALVGGDDPQAAFAAGAVVAREALAAADLDHVVTTPMGEMAIRQRSEGVFGAEVEPPADATVTEHLMAWSGRRVR